MLVVHVHGWLARVVVMATLAVGCGSVPPPGPTPKEPVQPARFDGLPVSFEYPGDWMVEAASDEPALEDGSSEAEPGGEQDQGAVGPSARVIVGLDQLDRVVVTGSPGQRVVTPANFDQVRGMIQDEVEPSFGDDGKIVAGPDVVTVGLQPALRWVLSSPSGVGYVVTSTVYVIFRGSRQYRVMCSHIPAKAEEITLGCAQVLETAEFTYNAPLVPGASPAPSASPSPQGG
jgi:hypothetical protein